MNDNYYITFEIDRLFKKWCVEKFYYQSETCLIGDYKKAIHLKKISIDSGVELPTNRMYHWMLLHTIDTLEEEIHQLETSEKMLLGNLNICTRMSKSRKSVMYLKGNRWIPKCKVTTCLRRPVKYKVCCMHLPKSLPDLRKRIQFLLEEDIVEKNLVQTNNNIIPVLQLINDSN